MFRSEVRFKTLKGNDIDTILSFRIPKTREGFNSVPVSIIDITERKKAEERLHVAIEAADQANKAKSEFLAVMSHEIRTPMNAILGMTEMARELSFDAEQLRYLKVVGRSGDNLMNLIDDILALSRIEAGHLTLEKKPVDLDELTREALEIHDYNAKNKGLSLRCDIKTGTPEQFNGDKKRLRQVLLNLIGNAVKFTLIGEVQLKVSRPDHKHLLFTVADTGIGISETKRQLIFDPFFQADSSLTRQHGGIGLGLTICKRLVDAMGGRIWIESEIGKGSTFFVQIPI